MELAIINGTYRDSQSKNSSHKFSLFVKSKGKCLLFFLILAGLDSTTRLLASNPAALHTMVTHQNAALRNAAAAAAAPLGGAPLILSPRLQMPPTTMASQVQMLNGGAAGHQPPPLIAPGDTQGLLYAQYAAAAASDYANYSGLVSPLLAAAEYSADPSGGLFAR